MFNRVRVKIDPQELALAAPRAPKFLDLIET